MRFKSESFRERYRWDKEKSLTNEDPSTTAYLKYVFDKAEELAEKLEELINHYEGESPEKVINDETSTITNGEWDDGMSAYQYGLVMYLLSTYWLYGEYLRKWHNNEMGEPEASGVVNPAVVNLNVE